MDSQGGAEGFADFAAPLARPARREFRRKLLAGRMGIEAHALWCGFLVVGELFRQICEGLTSHYSVSRKSEARLTASCQSLSDGVKGMSRCWVEIRSPLPFQQLDYVQRRAIPPPRKSALVPVRRRLPRKPAPDPPRLVKPSRQPSKDSVLGPATTVTSAKSSVEIRPDNNCSRYWLIRVLGVLPGFRRRLDLPAGYGEPDHFRHVRDSVAFSA
jgi:hypothetical protein